jgi:hypothetical protein
MWSSIIYKDMSKRINCSLPEWVFVGRILPNEIETQVN